MTYAQRQVLVLVFPWRGVPRPDIFEAIRSLFNVARNIADSNYRLPSMSISRGWSQFKVHNDGGARIRSTRRSPIQVLTGIVVA